MKSCACCIGGEDDEDEDAENEEDGEQRSSKPDEVDKDDVAVAPNSKKVRSKYVDGKNQFAFDPTMFNKM